MTAGDARLDAIQARLDAAQHHGAPAFMIPTADVAYLLAELRKAREALTRVEEVHFEGIAYADDVAEGCDEPVPDDYEHHFCQEDGEDWPCATTRALRAAVAAANGDGNG